MKGADGRLSYRGKPLSDAQNSAFGRMMTLAENGIDPYAVWIELLRHRRISPWISLRMNDVHDANNEDSHMHCDLWREHPEYRRTDYQFTPWYGQGLDYAVPEVRRRSLALVKEYLFDHDFDGIELDWMRTPPHFKPAPFSTGGPTASICSITWTALMRCMTGKDSGGCWKTAGSVPVSNCWPAATS